MSDSSISKCPVCDLLLYRPSGGHGWRCGRCDRGATHCPTSFEEQVAFLQQEVARRRSEIDQLRAQNDTLAHCVRVLTAEIRAEHEQREAAQAALQEVMGELRQVCVILGGTESERAALALASEARLALDLHDAVQARHVERGDRYRRRALALLPRLRAYRRWRWLDTVKTKKLVDQCSVLHDQLKRALAEQRGDCYRRRALAMVAQGRRRRDALRYLEQHIQNRDGDSDRYIALLAERWERWQRRAWALLSQVRKERRERRFQAGCRARHYLGKRYAERARNAWAEQAMAEAEHQDLEVQRLADVTCWYLDRRDDLARRLGAAREAAGTLAAWLAMVEADRELGGAQPYPDRAVLLSYMGRGASCMVTAGDLRALLRALAADPEGVVEHVRGGSSEQSD